jgi:hypothetical protein
MHHITLTVVPNHLIWRPEIWEFLLMIYWLFTWKYASTFLFCECAQLWTSLYLDMDINWLTCLSSSWLRWWKLSSSLQLLLLSNWILCYRYGNQNPAFIKEWVVFKKLDNNISAFSDGAVRNRLVRLQMWSSKLSADNEYESCYSSLLVPSEASQRLQMWIGEMSGDSKYESCNALTKRCKM